jgi:heptosyltransferase-2
LSPDDYQFADRVYSQCGSRDERFWVAICPGAGIAQKVWPIERYITVAAWLVKHYQACIVVVGGAEDVLLSKEILVALGDRAISIVGIATLRQTAAVLARCSLLLSNCTGPMHLAAAVKTPIVEVCCHARSSSMWHERSPLRFGPQGVRTRVLQPDIPLSPCVDGCQALEPHCITQVTVEEVQRGVSQILGSPFL